MRYNVLVGWAALLTGVSAAAASAQSPREGGGIVLVGVADGQTGAPIANADVRLTSAERNARTDWLGRAQFSGLRRGGHHIAVRALGYEPLSVVVDVRDGARDTLEAVLFLERPSVKLDAVSIVGKGPRDVPVRLREVEARRRLGFGQYITAQELEGEWSQSLADVLSVRFAGLRRTTDSMGRARLYSTRSTALMRDAHPNRCPIDVFFDGMHASDGDVDLPMTPAVAAVEYYTKTAAPPQYRRAGQACGVLLVWFKAGR